MGDREHRSRNSNKSESKKLIEELKNCRKTGQKLKYDIKEDELIYEYVDSKKYEEIVSKRIKNDWVVNDLGNEYYDPGVEIHELPDNDMIPKNEEILDSTAVSKKRKEDGFHEDIGKLLKSLKKKEPPKDTCVMNNNQPDTLLESILKKIDNCKEPVSTRELKTNNFNWINLKNDITTNTLNNISPINGEVRELSAPSPDIIDENDINHLSGYFDDDFEKDIGCFPDIDNDFDNNTNKSFNICENTNVEPNVYTDNRRYYIYYLDAIEESSKNSTHVYLFGKYYCSEEKNYSSCCVMITNIPKKIYLLPIKEIPVSDDTSIDFNQYLDVIQEFKSLTKPYKIQDLKYKLVKKNHCFNKEIPDVAYYVEITYQTTVEFNPKSLTGTTFSHILSYDMSCLELLLLEKTIKGPCWLSFISNKIHNKVPFSWCKKEYIVSDYSYIEVCTDQKPAPPLVCVSMYLDSEVNNKNESTIKSITLFFNDIIIDDNNNNTTICKNRSVYCAIIKGVSSISPIGFNDWCTKMGISVDVVTKESFLINIIASKLMQKDPDIINCHDFIGKGLDLWIHRCKYTNNINWSKIGRLRIQKIPKLFRSKDCIKLFPGRIIVDLKIVCKDLYKLSNYELPDLCLAVLNKSFMDRSESDSSSSDTFMSNKSLQKHLIYLKNCVLSMNLILNRAQILPLYLQITIIVGGILTHTFLRGKSERNEFLLMHSFYAKNFICPDRPKEWDTKDKFNSKTPKYEGGLVLDPQIGFYDTIILLIDFNSLYPSIIQEYNICFTKKYNDFNVPSDVTDGVIPLEIKKLVDRRRMIKNMLNDMKNQPKFAELEIRQKALKLIANSMYGCLGTIGNRFSCQELASVITQNGRNILRKAQKLVESLGFEVIYGDTDSLMVNTQMISINEALEIEKKIRIEINSLYRCLEIECDAIYKPLLLLKKKKYAAVPIKMVDGKIVRGKAEIKGLELVRRDWSVISKDCAQKILDILLTEKERDEIVDSIFNYLSDVKNSLDSGSIDLNKFTINKMLTKSPKEYVDSKSLPHVVVALRQEQTFGGKFGAGDIIKYVICDDGTNNTPMQRAYSFEELNLNSKLKIDVNYYILNQIHPVVGRICYPFAEIGNERLASVLGINKVSSHVEPNPDNDLIKYSLEGNVDRLIVKCLNKSCSSYFQPINFEFSSINEKNPINCFSCNNPFSMDLIYNQCLMLIRNKCFQYYVTPFVCNEPNCGVSFSTIPLSLANKNKCPECGNGILTNNCSEKIAYQQLVYLKQLIKFLQNNSSKTIYSSDQFYLINDMIQNILNICGFGIIDFSTIFSCCN